MTLTRRTALKQLGLITGGILLLPGCVRHSREVSLPLKNISITGDQEMMLGNVVGTIIPAGEIAGAKELNVHHFVLKMIDDCQGPENQAIFLKGFRDLDLRSHKKFDKSFSSLPSGQKETLLREMENESISTNADKKKNQPATFISLTKKYTIQGFLQSEFIMTNVLVYNMIPGRFDGCIPMEKNKKFING